MAPLTQRQVTKITNRSLEGLRSYEEWPFSVPTFILVMFVHQGYPVFLSFFVLMFVCYSGNCTAAGVCLVEAEASCQKISETARKAHSNLIEDYR